VLVRPIVAAILVAALSTAARADEDETPRITRAVASSTAGAAHGVEKLFDLDEATTWCAREKAQVSVAVQLSRPAVLRAARLSLGDFANWKKGPRIKQVFVTVLDGDKTVKKVRHKWPDADEPRDGKVNLDAPGNAVLVEIDLVYAGTGSGGLCLSGVTLEHGADGDSAPLDGADLAAVAWGAKNLEKMLPGVYTVVRAGPEGDVSATLELKKRGRFEYEDEQLDLVVQGKWSVSSNEDGAVFLELDVRKAKAGGKRIGIPSEPHVVAWRFGVQEEGGAPTFVPWNAYLRDENGALVPAPPVRVSGGPR
jgi:hypothetical protein